MDTARDALPDDITALKEALATEREMSRSLLNYVGPTLPE
jgi:hypothetical protein